MADTSIQWTDKVWNPTRGCSLKSKGCSRCYAMRMAHRFGGPGQPYEGLTRLGAKGPVWTGEVREAPEMLGMPLGWRKPCRIFVNSMSDLFHEKLSDEYIAVVFGIMAATPRHTYQILTKRAERLPGWFRWFEDRTSGRHRIPAVIEHAACAAEKAGNRALADRLFGAANDNAGRDHWPLPNVWLGVSVEDQATADERIPHLLGVPAAVRFLSAEPLLGPVNLGLWRVEIPKHREHWPVERVGNFWVIAGGESGAGARPCAIDWIRSVVRQCRDAGVPAFVKQLGAHVEACDIIDAMDDFPGSVRLSPGTLPHNARVHLRDPKGGDVGEFPADLQVREFPAVGAVPLPHAADLPGQGMLFQGGMR